MTWVTFWWQHLCCYGKVCVNIKRCCQTTCLHWDIWTLEDGKSAKIFYMVRKRNVWLIIVLLGKRPWEIQLYPVYTPPFIRQYRARAKTSETFPNIRKTFENANGFTGIFHNCRYLGLPSKRKTKLRNIYFFASVISKRPHWLHWACILLCRNRIWWCIRNPWKQKAENNLFLYLFSKVHWNAWGSNAAFLTLCGPTFRKKHFSAL